MKTAISTIFLVLAVISPAFAGNPAVVYKSGILVSVFVGVCALIVVAQLVPALMLVVGFIKGLAHKRRDPSDRIHNYLRLTYVDVAPRRLSENVFFPQLCVMLKILSSEY